MASKAIIIGCSTYQFDAIPDLRYAEDDAQALHARLIDPDVGGFDPPEARLLIAPVHVVVSITLEQLLQGAGPTDSVIVYFAGHGLRDDRGQMYLAVTDTHPDLLRATSISARYVRELLDDCRSRQVCVILDCCFSGAFGHGQRSALNSGDVKAALGTLEAEGTIVLTSSQASQQSRESEKYSHGTFTHYLLEGLDGVADTDSDGLITPVELYQFVSARMEREVGPGQRPMFIGALSGGSFPIVRSKSKRDVALSNLDTAVTALVERREHETALERIRDFNTVNPREEQFVRAMEERLRGDKDRLVAEFRRQLYREGGERSLSGEVLHEADSILARHPDSLFRLKNRNALDKREVILRNHFVGRIDAAAMEELWPRPSTDPHPTNQKPEALPASTADGPLPTEGPLLTKAGPGERPRLAGAPPTAFSTNHKVGPKKSTATPPTRAGRVFRSHAFQLTVWIVALAATATWMYASRMSKEFDPKAIKIGLLLKSDWPDAAAKFTFSEVARQLRSRMDPVYGFDTEIRTYSRLDEVVRALRAGQIDVAGELAPWDIYEAKRVAMAVPFISAQYDGQYSYFSVVFMPTSSHLFVRKETPTGLETDPVATWNNVLISLDGGNKLAVSREPSTSGYWYPRYMVLRGFAALGKRERSFEDVAERLDNNQMLATVACGTAKIIAGVTSNFRFQSGRKQQCGGNEVTLDQVASSDPIRHGAFVMRNVLAGDPVLVQNLKGHWENAVRASAKTPNGIELETTWTRVDLSYYENAKHVFEEPDPVVQRRMRVLIAACALLVVTAMAYVWLATRRIEVPAAEASATDK